MTSHVVKAKALYFAFVEDLATTCCFLAFQGTGESPNITQNSIVDLLDMGHPSRSLFEYVVSTGAELDACNIP